MIKFNFDILYILSKDDLLEILFNLTLLKFIYKKVGKLFDIKSQFIIRLKLKSWNCKNFLNYGFLYKFNNIKIKNKAKFGFKLFA